ncbi:MAG TPA: PqqD family protein [Blastocatellia bacterium]|jgi:hypothetical protein
MTAEYPALHPQVAMQVVDGLTVIVLADSGEVLVLNALGTRILDLIDGKRTITEIARLIEEEYDVSAEQARRDLDEFLRTLSEAGALSPA